MIIVFLVDTSASMNQKFSNGMSALECTKSGIEHLVKVTCAPLMALDALSSRHAMMPTHTLGYNTMLIPLAVCYLAL